MENILVSDVQDGVCTIKLDRVEKKNALSIALRDEVSVALEELAGHPDIKVLIITGKGNMFSAGFDLSEFQKASGDPAYRGKLWTSSDRFHHACLFFPLPLIAAVNGPAIAGGFDLAIMCDIRIASPNAYFSHPEVTFGDVIYSPLHDMVGGGVARELVLTGRKVDAEEALKLNLVSQVVSQERLDDRVHEVARQIAQAPRENLLNTKRKIIARASIKAHATLEL